MEDYLRHLFEQAGWEGDGQISCIHIPPFLRGDYESHCRTVFHVKQSHRGTSFLAFDHFEFGLSEQIEDEMLEKGAREFEVKNQAHMEEVKKSLVELGMNVV